jgi:hypothetical protein
MRPEEKKLGNESSTEGDSAPWFSAATDENENLWPRSADPRKSTCCVGKQTNAQVRQRFSAHTLSRYPEYPEASRLTFPEHLPMFVFPNDISIKVADDRPRAAWHSFTLTQSSGERIHGTCVIVWLPLAPAQADELEARCGSWNQTPLPPEKNNQALLLSAQLANERSQLSQLLIQFAHADDTERERLTILIDACEERIGLHSDSIKSSQHPAAEVESLPQGARFWFPQAYGLLGRDAAFQQTWRNWLVATCASYFATELQHVPLSHDASVPLLPFERYIVQFLDETPSPPAGRVRVSVPLRLVDLGIIKEAQNEVPGSRRVDLYPLFRALSLSNIIKLVTAAMLDSRIVFVSEHLSMLSLAAQGLLSLLYPFEWPGVFVPVLPHKLLQGLECPTPYIFGIHTDYAPPDWPSGDDIVICHLDQDIVQGTVPALPGRLGQKLLAMLSQASPMHSLYHVPRGAPQYCKEAYPSKSVVFGPGGDTSNTPSNLNAYLLERGPYGEAPKSMSQPPSLNISAAGEAWQEQSSVTPLSPIRSLANRHHRSDSTIRVVKRTGFSSMSLRRGSFISIQDLYCIESDTSTQLSSDSSSASLLERRRNQTMQLPPSPPEPSTAVSTPTSSSTHEHIKRSHRGDNPPNTTVHREGHRLKQTWVVNAATNVRCAFSRELIDGPSYSCLNCGLQVAANHINDIHLPCLSRSFDSDKVHAAFLRLFATLMRDYRLFMQPTAFEYKRTRGESERERIFCFNEEAFLKHTALQLGVRNQPEGFLARFSQTSLFAGFIDTRCREPVGTPSIALFDDIILAKLNRSKVSLFGTRSEPRLLLDTYELHRRTLIAPKANDSHLPKGWQQEAASLPSKLRPAMNLYPRNCAF